MGVGGKLPNQNKTRTQRCLQATTANDYDRRRLFVMIVVTSHLFAALFWRNLFGALIACGPAIKYESDGGVAKI